MSPCVSIACDDRERASGVVEALQQIADVAVSIQRLRVGDYLVDGRVLVERKTVRDLATSIIDGRLFRQALMLVQAAPGRALLLVEGDRQTLAACGVRREAWQGALVTLGVMLGIPVLRARDAAESARILRYTADQMRRMAVGSVRRAGYRPRRLRARQLFVLQGLPGVGPERATRLLDAFGSVAGVFAADEAQLRRVHGLGPRTAADIWRIAHGPKDEIPAAAPGESGATTSPACSS
jgi:ERCC4-type nuclease